MPAHQDGSGRLSRVGRANRALGIACLVGALIVETTMALVWGVAPGWRALIVVWIPPALMVALFVFGRPVVDRIVRRRAGLAGEDPEAMSGEDLRRRPLYPIVMLGPDLSVAMARRPDEIADRAKMAASGLALERAFAGDLGGLGRPDPSRGSGVGGLDLADLVSLMGSSESGLTDFDLDDAWAAQLAGDDDSCEVDAGDLTALRAFDVRLRPVVVSKCGSGAIATLASQEPEAVEFENAVSEVLLAYRRTEQPVCELRSFIDYLAFSQRNGVIGQLHL